MQGELNLLGTIVNVIAIIMGTLIGLFLKGGIPQKISSSIMDGLALCIIYIGISGSLKGNNVLLIIISIALGAIIGESIDIDKRILDLGNKIENRFKSDNSRIAEGFVTSSLLFSVGAMAIVGSLENGLTGNCSTLFVKSMLDGISSIIFASTLGIGVIFSSVIVFIYQGTLTIAASYLKPVLITSVVNNMTAVGSLLILGLGLNMLKVTKIKVANLLPAIFIPIIYQLILNIISRLGNN